MSLFTSNGLVRPNYKAAERAALRLLRDNGVVEPPIDPVEMARSRGVEVFFADFAGESRSAVSGYYDFKDNSIYVNKADDPRRQLFTIAHELGHHLLHDEWARSSDYKVLWRDPTRRGRDTKEQEANAFAANLLMPRELMDEYYRILPLPKLARLFAVSVPAMEARLNFLYGL